MLLETDTSLQFLKVLPYATLKWYRDNYAEMLDDPDIASPTQRIALALLNAELAQRPWFEQGKEA